MFSYVAITNDNAKLYTQLLQIQFCHSIDNNYASQWQSRIKSVREGAWLEKDGRSTIKSTLNVYLLKRFLEFNQFKTVQCIGKLGKLFILAHGTSNRHRTPINADVNNDLDFYFLLQNNKFYRIRSIISNIIATYNWQ